MRYGLGRRLKRGVRLSLFLTFKCNLDCIYCPNKFVYNRMPVCHGQLNYEQWLLLIDSFPMKIKEVYLTGGEPFLYFEIVKLIEGLIKRKIYITIFTNLLMKRQIPKYSRMRIVATLHKNIGHVMRRRFDINLKYYREFCPVNVHVLDESRHDTKISGENKTFFRIIETKENNTCLDASRFICAPDGSIFSNSNYITIEKLI